MAFPDYDADGKTSPYDIAATHHYLGEIEKGGGGGGDGCTESGCVSIVAVIIGILLAIIVIGHIHSCAGA